MKFNPKHLAIMFAIFAGIVMFSNLMKLGTLDAASAKEVSYSTLLKQLEGGQVSGVVCFTISYAISTVRASSPTFRLVRTAPKMAAR